MNELIIYVDKKDNSKIEVRLEKNSIWLKQEQISKLFGTLRPAITKHISNIYKSGELKENSTCSILEHMGRNKKIYTTKIYNLDMIISIGYRVNSIKATQFRIWATDVLKHYLLDGYKIDEKRLKLQNEKINELKKTIEIIAKVSDSNKLTTDESKSLINVIFDYSNALDLLDEYDNQSLKIISSNVKERFRIKYTDVLNVVNDMKVNSVKSKLFGKERNNQLEGIIEVIYQTYSGKELYPDIFDKAAHLLYFLIKDHPFVDGNKRIAATVFLWFLFKNKLLYGKNGNKIIEEGTLAALTLMTAQSNPKEKDIIVKVIIKLLTK